MTKLDNCIKHSSGGLLLTGCDDAIYDWTSFIISSQAFLCTVDQNGKVLMNYILNFTPTKISLTL